MMYKKTQFQLLKDIQTQHSNKKKVPILFLICFLLIPAIVQALLSFPQKIVIDDEHDRLLVSNFGDGSLVAIDSDDNQSYFVEDAGFVDGMDIVDNVVYGVGFQRKLYGYDLDTGEQVLDFHFPGSNDNYLSSVTSDSTGHLFISCPGMHAIYKFRISDQAYWIFAQENGLNRPNGILLERDNDRIVVIDDSNITTTIHGISLSDSTVTDLLTANLDNPDGIVRDANGYYYIGGYYLSGIYRVDPDFGEQPEMFFEGTYMVYPTYDARDHSLLITYYNAHTVGRIMLPGAILIGTVSLSPSVNVEDVEIAIGSRRINPDSNGIFSVRLPVGTYSVTASLEGYETLTYEDLVIVDEQIESIYFEMYYIQEPENLSYTLDQNTVSLTWDHGSNAYNPGGIQVDPDRQFQNYNIYRNFNGGNFEILISTSEQYYNDVLEQTGEYSYYITAQYAQENESEPSNTEIVFWNGTNMEESLISTGNVQLRNYPNPFNPSTVISFNLIEINATEANLEIINLKGQKVKEFIVGNLKSGMNEVVWNGDDDLEKPVPSGVYFYKLNLGDFKLTKKMLLLK